MSNLNNILGAPYPFAYPSDNGFVYAGFEHSTDETIATYLEKVSNAYARHILFDEPYTLTTLGIIETVKEYTGIDLDVATVWEYGESKLNWYRETFDL